MEKHRPLGVWAVWDVTKHCAEMKITLVWYLSKKGFVHCVCRLYSAVMYLSSDWRI